MKFRKLVLAGMSFGIAAIALADEEGGTKVAFAVVENSGGVEVPE